MSCVSSISASVPVGRDLAAAAELFGSSLPNLSAPKLDIPDFPNDSPLPGLLPVSPPPKDGPTPGLPPTSPLPKEGLPPPSVLPEAPLPLDGLKPPLSDLAEASADGEPGFSARA